MTFYKNRKYLTSALSILCCGAMSQGHAALASNAVLDFNDGTVFCIIRGTAPDACAHGVTNVSGSYFGIDYNGNQTISIDEKNALTSAGTGLTLGSAQGVAEFDVAWFFGNIPGNFYTQTAPTVTSASGNTASIDMTGFAMQWNGGDFDLGTGTLANNGADHFAIITCGIDCAVGDSFNLDYAVSWEAFADDLFLTTLHLEGIIAAPAAVPIPAAVWLFGSGLIGLLGFARRQK